MIKNCHFNLQIAIVINTFFSLESFVSEMSYLVTNVVKAGNLSQFKKSFFCILYFSNFLFVIISLLFLTL